MKWIEIIELQSVDCNRELLESQLQQLINEVEKETNKQTITAYNRVLIDNDFSIHLIHNSKKAETLEAKRHISVFCYCECCRDAWVPLRKFVEKTWKILKFTVDAHQLFSYAYLLW